MRAMTHTIRAAWFAVGATAILAIGCNNAKKSGEVFGKITYNGKPVTAGTILFFPENGGDPVGGTVGPDGSYRATGLPLGRAKVAIETIKFKNLTPPPPGIAKQLGGPRVTYVPIPEKYEKPNPSGLSFEVEEGAREWNIVLE